MNISWGPGIGNITNSYNVSVNGTWTNGSTSTFVNETVLPGTWVYVTVYGYNSTGVTALSETPMYKNVQLSSLYPNPIKNLVCVKTSTTIECDWATGDI